MSRWMNVVITIKKIHEANNETLRTNNDKERERERDRRNDCGTLRIFRYKF